MNICILLKIYAVSVLELIEHSVNENDILIVLLCSYICSKLKFDKHLSDVRLMYLKYE